MCNDQDVELQSCSKCGSIEVNNIIVGASPNQQRVYSRCARCNTMIAWCDVKTYFPAEHALEHYLSNHRGIESDSGRRWLARFNETRTAAEAEYQEALKALKPIDNSEKI